MSTDRLYQQPHEQIRNFAFTAQVAFTAERFANPMFVEEMSVDKFLEAPHMAVVNALLPKIAAKRGAEWLDLSGSFLDGNGVLHESVMPDLLHPWVKGYWRHPFMREPWAYVDVERGGTSDA